MGFALIFIGLIANNIKVIVVFGPYVVGIRAQTVMKKKKTKQRRTHSFYEPENAKQTANNSGPS